MCEEVTTNADLLGLGYLEYIHNSLVYMCGMLYDNLFSIIFNIFIVNKSILISIIGLLYFHFSLASFPWYLWTYIMY